MALYGEIMCIGSIINKYIFHLPFLHLSYQLLYHLYWILGYPMPPNVTINKIVYSSRQRTEIDMEWFTKTEGDITGFIIERRRLPQPAGKRDTESPWQKVAVNLDPSTQTYKMSGFDPTGLYAVRITAVNHRTIGYPSEAKSPGEPLKCR